MHDVFISYSRNDNQKVKRFRDELLKAGFSVWMDVDGVESGDEFKEKIANAIANSSVFLFFSSKYSNASPWVTKEVGVASNLQKRIIPVKLDKSQYSMKLMMDLINLDYIDCSDPSRLRERLYDLIKVLKKSIPRNETDEYLFCPKCHCSQLRVKLQNSQWEEKRRGILDDAKKMISSDGAGTKIAGAGMLASSLVMGPFGIPVALMGGGLLAAKKIKKFFSKDGVEGGGSDRDVEVAKVPSVVFICDKCGSVFDMFDIGVQKGEQ